MSSKLIQDKLLSIETSLHEIMHKMRLRKFKTLRAVRIIQRQFRRKKQTRLALVQTEKQSFDFLQVDNIILSQFPTNLPMHLCMEFIFNVIYQSNNGR